ncbi:hypothetical protein BT96DRAFT_1001938 [Gymnopus androsaceus JB14]|uniref:beta-glucosidase n=1 Tax=Gymnopus androsaceus JB14 TaxID=1447944 RepID=A0A6A4GY33_9AGAR|nr:hypothetical protein BT96DRAFT_1001938 [Gymnopus androsaceus JB14]
MNEAVIQFNYTTSPFSFTIYRTSTSEVLFTTGSHPIIFEPQYLRVKIDLPSNANIYGLGEHQRPVPPSLHTTRTFWSRDAYLIPTNTNLYGNHPIYFEHRTTGSHGVFLLNSNGMDVKINDTESVDSTTLEYNVIELSKQYAEVVGTTAEVPYWSFGFHQCRFGYTSFVDVANVITNYSAAEIPLETMWTDIDYMNGRRIFTVDPDYFPLPRMREIVDYLHAHDQHYVFMTDPANGEPIVRYERNKVRTTKYDTPESLCTVASRCQHIFLFLDVVQSFPVFGEASGAISVHPLAFILFVTTLKDAFKDYLPSTKNFDLSDHGARGKRLDDIMCIDSHSYPPGDASTPSFSETSTRVGMGSMSNYAQSQHLRSTSGLVDSRKLGYTGTLWKKLEVGDIVLLKDNEQVPADVVLATLDPDGTCYLEAKTWTERRIVNHGHPEPPHQNLYLYHGVLRYKDPATGERKQEPVSMNELLLRG